MEGKRTNLASSIYTLGQGPTGWLGKKFHHLMSELRRSVSRSREKLKTWPFLLRVAAMLGSGPGWPHRLPHHASIAAALISKNDLEDPFNIETLTSMREDSARISSCGSGSWPCARCLYDIAFQVQRNSLIAATANRDDKSLIVQISHASAEQEDSVPRDLEFKFQMWHK